MTNNQKEEVKSILNKWGDNAGIIEYENQEINRIKEIMDGMTSVRAVTYSLAPKGKSNNSPVERAFFNAMEVCEKRLKKLSSRVEEYINEKEYIDSIIEKMDYEKQFIIKAKYMDKLSWDDIVKKYPHTMSLRNFYRLHNDALTYIYNFINNK